MHEFIDQNYGNLRDDSQVVYHAVSKDEPPGRQLDKIKTVPVRLSVSHSDDSEVLEKKGIQGLRQHKLIRFASEAYDQGVDYELPFIDDNEKLKLLQCLNIMMV